MSGLRVAGGIDVRRLAALDMHGSGGGTLRRLSVLAEFVLAAVVGLAGGVFLIAASEAAWTTVLGAAVAGIGANYVPLAVHALSLTRPGALADELGAADARGELRRYSLAQLWLAAPFTILILDLRQRRARAG